MEVLGLSVLFAGREHGGIMNVRKSNTFVDLKELVVCGGET